MIHSIGRRIGALLLSAALAFSVAPGALAEDSGVQEAPTAPSYAIKSVKLTPETVPSLKLGAEQTLYAQVTVEVTEDGEKKEVTLTKDTPAEQVPAGLTIDWEVAAGREKEVSVRKNGSNPFEATATALAVAASNADPKAVYVTVTAALDGKSVKSVCGITVISTETPGIKVSPTTMEIAPAVTKQITATVTPESADQSVSWNSANTNVATVTPGKGTATVTGISAGQTTITATANGLQAQCVVQVQGVVLNTGGLVQPLRVGDNYALDYTIYGDSLKSKGVTWSTSNSSVVRVESGYLYAVDEGTATITVKINGVTYSDSVTVTVKQGTAEVIPATARAGAPLEFSSLVSSLQTQSLSVLRMNLSYVSGLWVEPSQGTLYYRYASDGDTGAGVGTGERYYVSPGTGQMSLSDIVFVPKADFEGTATISYTGYASGSSFFQGTIAVTVALEQDVTYSVSGSKPVQFNAADFVQVCRSRTGRDLSHITFSLPEREQGTLYYNYLSAQSPGTPVTATEQYRYTGSPNLSEVYFIPAANATGEVIFLYTAWDVNGVSYRGRVTIQITASTATGDIAYSTLQNGRVTFEDVDFNNLSRTLTGYALDRVRFTLPSSAQGVMYYNYTASENYTSAVSADRDYYRSSYPYLDAITFVAAEGYSGTVSIPFTAWDIQGNRFYGEVSVSVEAQKSGTIRYTTFREGRVTFDDTDFNTLSMELTGSSLRYVRFFLPASSQGTLYYKYNASTGGYESKVSEDRSYYRTTTPNLDNVTFVATDTFSGTVSIPFTGWNISGKTFSGTVEIAVDNVPDPLKYEVRGGEVLTFRDTDFNDYCLLATGENLNYVRFTTPPSSYGTLYYNYRSSNSYDSKVSAYRNYYRSSAPYVEKVSFVPHDDYSGTFSLNFTGWSTGGRQFTGTATITVIQGQPGIITYTTAYQPVTLRAEDFVAACAQRGKGDLVSVQFTGVNDIKNGYLYYRYGGFQSTGSQVRADTIYYPAVSPMIDEITFVPRVGYQGTVTLTYTGKDSRSGTYQGTVQIRVVPNTTSSYFTDMGRFGWAAASVDFLYENGVVQGAGGTQYAPQAAITRGSFLVMLDRAFSFPSAGGYTFTDVPDNAYYAQAVQRAYALGVVQGYPDGSIHPDDPITREVAAVMLYRAMQASGWSVGAQNVSVLYGYADWLSVSEYARGPLSALVEAGLFSGDNVGRLLPGQTMTRAEMAVVLARALTL